LGQSNARELLDESDQRPERAIKTNLFYSKLIIPARLRAATSRAWPPSQRACKLKGRQTAPIAMTDDKGTNQTAAFFFVYVTVLLDALSLGIVFPVLPNLMTEFASAPALSAPYVVGLFGTVWGLMQLLISPVQSVLSDHFGRRPLLLISNVSLGLGYILMALAPGFHWLLAGRVICGMSSASISTAFAYRSDVLPVERRTDGFGVLGVAMAAGTLFGPALGGLLGSDDLRLPFWIAAGLSVANGIFGFLVLPESLARHQRAPF
jgi:MFS transporter, DHA1 family, tetracycline resistance protein